jgi:DNA-binding NarL/FixJ family response regulator
LIESPEAKPLKLYGLCARIELLMTTEKTKVFIFSQQPLYGEGIRHLLSGMETVQILGRAKVTDTAVLLTIETMPPDIAIIDIDAPSESGLSLAGRLRQLIPSVRVIALTSSPNDDELFQALKSQVAAYLSKEISGDYLADALRRVARGEYPINESLSDQPKVAEQILRKFQELSGDKKVETLVSPLTPRETEILTYIAQGYANKQIAATLNISDQTIKNHVTSILSKLNANARTEAVVIALKKGLISAD